ncbi:hypothetical protein DFH09DRAFT_564497 [Mycena vulgaris]|nr:hypothetical protein DFH09DRAFT_564497 [Mycena vulgaris]
MTGIVSWRVRVINGIWVAVPLAILGLLPPVINVAISNPSVFPQCRVLSSAPTARIITILPCLRAAFDAATTLALLFKIWRHIASMGALASNTVSFVLSEEIKDIILIFAIMAMEAVFVQIPSARAHARNYVVPFVDALTAILTTRFMFELEERGRAPRTTRRDYGTSRVVTRSTTLVGSGRPAASDNYKTPPTSDGPGTLPMSDASGTPATRASDDSASLHTFETRSIGWNRVGGCLGARAF